MSINAIADPGGRREIKPILTVMRSVTPPPSSGYCIMASSLCATFTADSGPGESIIGTNSSPSRRATRSSVLTQDYKLFANAMITVSAARWPYWTLIDLKRSMPSHNRANGLSRFPRRRARDFPDTQPAPLRHCNPGNAFGGPPQCPCSITPQWAFVLPRAGVSRSAGYRFRVNFITRHWTFSR